MMVYDCPHCEHTDTARMRLVDHVRSTHDDPLFCERDLPPARAVDHVRRFTAAISCRTCGRDTRRTDDDPTFHHVDDGTPACVDPDTLQPYPTKESSTMTRIRPSTKSDREWYASLSDENRTKVRAHVVELLVDKPQGEAWTEARTAFENAAEFMAAPVFDRIVKPAPEPSAQKPARDATERPERTRGRQPALVSYWLNDKPKRGLASLAYDGTRGMADPAPRMSAAQFRAYLTEQQIADPTSTAWRLELPNGNVIHTTLREQPQRKAS